ncbi:non-ribosomal peptide synthetase [Pedobacter hartonius]|uniref:Acyl-CoA synthetase (AMP-forming)/AMP-acid ligase II n=1 Tax=Pedobacter hartonius TaxID=425514 RepID=A0A1H3XBD4_9SPHI|nr:AMP-binding protein [Pedobacter hartonius]SDZ96715.1 Acyl-CoA synthetase (AMP-forming)/AMP-acid ligase II [Pedobacter hartonius]
MNYPSTLIQALNNQTNSSRAIHYIRAEQKEHSITYTRLRERALGLLHHFQQSGVSRGDQMVLITQRNEAFLEAFWASLFGAVTAVPLSFGISDEHKWKLFRILRQLSRPWIVIDQANVLRLEKFAESNGLESEWMQVKDRLFMVEQIPNFTAAGTTEEIDRDETAFIQFSSGTTSDPKGVVLSHRNLVTNIIGIGEGMKISERDTTFSWMPLSHDMGLIGFHLTPLFFGIDQYIMPTEIFIRRPVLWLEKISQPNITVTCSPNFGYQHCLNAWAPAHAGKIILAHIRLIFNGAEPISVSLTEQFLQTFEPFGLKRETMFAVYGLAEASLAVAFPEAGKPLKQVMLSRHHLSTGAQVVADASGIVFMAEGKAVQGCEIRITDGEGNTLAPNTIGHIEIRGDNVTKGYLNLPELNATLIQNGWLTTGDLGFIDNDQDLVVTGREKDIIFVNAQNYYPHDLEIIAEKNLSIEKGKIAACGVRNPGDIQDQVILFVLHKGALEGFTPHIQALKRTITEQAGLEVAEVIPVAKLPKTTSGKLQRYLLGSRYLDGEFNDTIQQMRSYTQTLSAKNGKAPAERIEQFLKGLCDELIPEKQILPDDNIFEMGTTSLLLAQLFQRIDEAYPGKLEITDIFDYPTLSKLAAHIHSKE